jgi:hypothetical protein
VPVEIKYQDSDTGVVQLGKGLVTGREFIEAVKKIISDDQRLRRLRYSVTDMLDVEDCEMTDDELIAVAHLNFEAAQINPGLKIAIIVPNNFIYCLAKIWQTYAERTKWQSLIFWNRDEAQNWIRKLGESYDGV